MATTYSTYRLRAVASSFLVIENTPSHFSAHVYYGQTVGLIRIPLGTEVDLGPGDNVFPPRKGAQQSPTFQPTALARIPAGRILPITRIVD